MSRSGRDRPQLRLDRKYGSGLQCSKSDNCRCFGCRLRCRTSWSRISAVCSAARHNHQWSQLHRYLEQPYRRCRKSKWNTRGWTLQEQYLSSRLFVFDKETVAFSCRLCFRAEDYITEAAGANRYASDTNFGDSQWLQSSHVLKTSDVAKIEFHKILSSYAGRVLSRDEDMLRAFSGIMKLFELHIGPFHCGLPSRGFPQAFDWRMHHDDGESKRLQDFPSWSWAGWKYQLPPGSRSRKSSGPGFGYTIPKAPTPLLTFHLLSEEMEIITVAECSPRKTLPKLPQGLAAHFERSDDILLRFEELEVPHCLRKIAIGFATSLAKLNVCMEAFDPMNTNPVQANFRVSSLQNKHLGWMKLDRVWRAHQPQLLDFIIIGGNLTANIRLSAMLIEWIGNITYRITADNSLTVTPEQWLSCNPEGRFVVMA